MKVLSIIFELVHFLLHLFSPFSIFLTEEIESEDVYGTNEHVVNLLCKNKLPADYCWFQDPSGLRIPVSEFKPSDENDEYRFDLTHIFNKFFKATLDQYVFF